MVSGENAFVSDVLTVPSDEHLDSKEVRRRATAGAFIITARGLLVNLFAFAGGLALARLLSPQDFGVVAFGLTILTLTRFLSDGGVGAMLIRTSETVRR